MKAASHYLHKYLQTYAEAETRQLADFPAREWDYSLLIPAFDESGDFVDRLKTGLLQQHRVLLLVVINQPDTLPQANHLNSLLEQQILGSGEVQWQSGQLTLINLRSGSSILLVDRYRQPIPAKQGVGLARKIAADLATALIHRQQIRCPWFFSTDADCLLPWDYFAPVATIATGAAFIYPFRHLCGKDDRLGQATRLYERALQHYVDGLQFAGSPYGFHTIGSIMAVHHRHYAMVRGFPKKAGGEDFYLLNKLAKTGPVVSLTAPTLEIHSRASHRVPFGTGPAVTKILAMENPMQQFLIYNPQVFTELRQCLEIFTRLHANSAELEKLSAISRNALEALGIRSALAHCRQQSKDKQGFEKQLHIWFDSFRTLKFVHYLQNNGLPAVAFNRVYNND